MQGGGLGAQQSSGGSRPEVGPLAWNPRFVNILAMGLSNGTVVMWDVGKEKGSKPKPVATLRNPSGYVCGPSPLPPLSRASHPVILTCCRSFCGYGELLLSNVSM